MDIGLTAIKLGEEARVDLHRFDLDAKGKEMKDLRYTWNRGTRDGLSLEIHEPGEAPMDELKVISDAWLTGKNVREKASRWDDSARTTSSIFVWRLFVSKVDRWLSPTCWRLTATSCRALT